MTGDTESASFVVEGNPIPKQRARTYRDKRTGRVVTVTPQETAAWEAKVRTVGLHTMGRAKPWKEPLAVRLSFYRQDRHACDIDNLVKAVFDALNGVVWVNDHIITDTSFSKRVSGLRPRVEVVVRKLTPLEAALLEESPPKQRAPRPRKPKAPAKAKGTAGRLPSTLKLSPSLVRPLRSPPARR